MEVFKQEHTEENHASRPKLLVNCSKSGTSDCNSVSLFRQLLRFKSIKARDQLVLLWKLVCFPIFGRHILFIKVHPKILSIYFSLEDSEKSTLLSMKNKPVNNTLTELTKRKEQLNITHLTLLLCGQFADSFSQC